MKEFILGVWYSIIHCSMYSVRGVTRASIILLATIFIASMMPKDIAIFTQHISLESYHFAVYAIGMVLALEVLVTTWIRDYKRDYIPRWLLS
ncbi:hypothetical protein [Psychrobacter sp. UBA2514]|mgnify:CR=1 FL=1|jgi:hypothetical protein|uniref:hypothetical protein n=1 Tax=Psychrobacter sp. UBA2514 TaxID=1947346 RepID=UPI00257ED2C9|nr:hypothetical protein [Psychrobacter sp. UBA2514]